MSKVRFFRCSHCGNIVTFFHDSGAPLTCCNDLMVELIPNSVDAANEKHVPTVTMSDGILTANVGSVDHPMLEEHHIEFLFLETQHGGQIKYLEVGSKPCAQFSLVDDKPVAVYEYCNLHGLWKVDIQG